VAFGSASRGKCAMSTLTLREPLRRPTIPAPMPVAPTPEPRRAPKVTPPAILIENFWFNWCPTELKPKCRFATLQGARLEAARLRGLYKDKRFLTYEARLVPEEQTPGEAGVLT
jgi:hypothetical protein